MYLLSLGVCPSGTGSANLKSDCHSILFRASLKLDFDNLRLVFKCLAIFVLVCLSVVTHGLPSGMQCRQQLSLERGIHVHTTSVAAHASF